MSRAESGDRLADTHAHLLRAVDELTTSDAWRQMLTVAARFPTYSANNVLLIGVQRPEATRVAGFRTWQSLGRQVRKGEKGIAILAPCLYRPKEPAKAARTAAVDEQGHTEPGATRQLRGFRAVHVFDLAPPHGTSSTGSPPWSARADSPWNAATATEPTATPTSPPAPSASETTSPTPKPRRPSPTRSPTSAPTTRPASSAATPRRSDAARRPR